MTSHQTDTIQITSAALTHIRKQLDMTQADYLRLGVKESGCNGYMYMLDYLETPAQEDMCYEFEQDVKVCVAAADQELVLGTELDLITQGLNSALVFKNPKATSYCGCGESFALGSGGGSAEGSASEQDQNLADLAVNVGDDQ